MIGKNKRKKERLRYLQKLAAESILKYAPKPITKQELHDYRQMKLMAWLISEINNARYHKPSQTLTNINQTKLTSKPLQTTIYNTH